MAKTGRPLKFQTPEELEEKIEAYFAKCDEGEEVTELTKRGELITYTRAIPYTIEGLSLYLGCESETVRNYEKRDAFFGTTRHIRHSRNVSLRSPIDEFPCSSHCNFSPMIFQRFSLENITFALLRRAITQLLS